jgi:hypothetical protein
LEQSRFGARYWPWLTILAVAVLLTLPAALAPLKLHDSFWIDWVWTDQFAAELARGNLYPRWLPASHDGLGSPVFYYYPPLSFYPAGLLVLLGLTPGAAVIATFGLALAASGAAMYAWARDWTAQPLVAALFYMAAPYHLADFYGRGALAETAAIALIPLVALGMRKAAEGRGMTTLALAYAGMILTHLPLALLASLLLVAPYGLLLGWKRPRDLLACAAALALGVGLSAIYLLPALTLEPWRDGALLWRHEILRPAHWLLTTGAAPLDGMRLITLMVIVVIAMPAFYLAYRRSLWAGWALACCALVAGLVPFFWSLPLIQSVQFPFRALPLAEFGLATAIALKGDRMTGLLTVPALMLSGLFLLAQAPPAPAGVTAELLAGRHPDVPENLPPGERPYSWPSRWALDLAEAHRAPALRGGVTIEPVFHFPAWRVTCTGGEVATFADPETGLLAHDGGGCTRTLRWTGEEKIGALTSGLAFALLLLGWWLKRKRKRRLCPLQTHIDGVEIRTRSKPDVHSLSASLP